jgi:hypothetical protein
MKWRHAANPGRTRRRPGTPMVPKELLDSDMVGEAIDYEQATTAVP